MAGLITFAINLLVTMYVKHPVAAVTSSLDYLVLMIQKCVNTSYHEIVNYWYIFLTLSGLNSSFLMR